MYKRKVMASTVKLKSLEIEKAYSSIQKTSVKIFLYEMSLHRFRLPAFIELTIFTKDVAHTFLGVFRYEGILF